jgi:hypothetical protein
VPFTVPSFSLIIICPVGYKVYRSHGFACLFRIFSFQVPILTNQTPFHESSESTMSKDSRTFFALGSKTLHVIRTIDGSWSTSLKGSSPECDLCQLLQTRNANIHWFASAEGCWLQHLQKPVPRAPGKVSFRIYSLSSSSMITSDGLNFG